MMLSRILVASLIAVLNFACLAAALVLLRDLVTSWPLEVATTTVVLGALGAWWYRRP